MTKKIATLVECEDHGYIPSRGNMAKTFSHHILNLAVNSEYQDPRIDVTFHDGSLLSFIIYEGKVGFRCLPNEIYRESMEKINASE